MSVGLHKQRVLVVAAHPDDEMLGCGGTLARLCAAGSHVSILLLGEGPTAREGSPTAHPAASADPAGAARSEAEASARNAAATLEIADVRLAALPDNRFDAVPLLDIVQLVEAVKRDARPDLILTHHAGDLNMDHAITHRAVMTAFRPLPGEPKTVILGFEVPSSTEYTSPSLAAPFQPVVYVDISDYLDAKQRALAAYASEMRPWPHPRSHEGVEHLARLRGCQCGLTAAEAFALCRGVF